MALAVTPLYSATLGFVDNNRNRGSLSFYLPTGFTLAQYDERILELATAVGPLSNAGIDTGAVTLLYDDAAVVPANLDPSSEVERKLNLTFRTTNRFVKVRMQVPSPVFTLETDNTDEVDPANPLLAEFVDTVINGAFGPGNGIVAGSGVDVVGLERAFITHRNRRNRG